MVNLEKNSVHCAWREFSLLAVTILEVLMVCENRKFPPASATFFQCQLHSEEFLVADVVIALDSGQLPGEKCHWVELDFFSKVL